MSGFPQGIPVTSPFEGFFHPWEEFAGSALEVAWCLGKQSCFFCSHPGLAVLALPGQDGYYLGQRSWAGSMFSKN